MFDTGVPESRQLEGIMTFGDTFNFFFGENLLGVLLLAFFLFALLVFTWAARG
jgi:hypothetical protein